jgi:hypothetical protein
MWEVEYTDEFEDWWNTLTEEEWIDIDSCVGLLEEYGPNRSKHSHMRELRIQHAGQPYRVLYAFDPRRVAILLIGGKKTGKDRWYEKFVPIADKLYDQHLNDLKKDGLTND